MVGNTIKIIPKQSEITTILSESAGLDQLVKATGVLVNLNSFTAFHWGDRSKFLLGPAFLVVSIIVNFAIYVNTA